MNDFIARALEWVRVLLAPVRGRHRAATGPVTPPARRRAPHAEPRASRVPRMVGEPIDGDATALVRPYLVAYEQWRRRRELLLALDGIDVGPHWIHGVEVAAR